MWDPEGAVEDLTAAAAWPHEALSSCRAFVGKPSQNRRQAAEAGEADAPGEAGVPGCAG